MKMRSFSIRMLFAVLLALALFAGGAQAAPELTQVFAEGDAVLPGVSEFVFRFRTTEGGLIALQLLSGATGEAVCDVGSAYIDAGIGEMTWDGCLPDGSAVAPGSYMLAVCVRNAWGEESEQSLLSLTVLGGEQAQPIEEMELSGDATMWIDVAGQGGESEPVAAPAQENAVPQASSFWDMDPDAYDLTNPLHQQAIWDLMMQPITVLNVGQTEHVYPTNSPGISVKPYAQNTAGELHGTSQGVRVLEEDTDGDGYVLIEAYSNDGTVTKDSYMKSIDNKRIQGYVKKSLLKEVKPSQKYALLIDKLKQKLYIFENGAIIGDLDISTGLNSASQPYNETPAGEYITVSWVGEFVSGTMRAQYAIRINGGTLLHEVPYRYGADGKTKIYTEFEPKLGTKASHGCIRIQRRKNAEGQNMLWLWSNLEKNTRVFIWDDQGRQMYDPQDVIPAPDTPLYRNVNGGSNYHTVPDCSGVKNEYLPLTGDFTYADLDTAPFSALTPCVYCAAPPTKATLYERYCAEAEQVGQEITQDVKDAFGIQ